MASIIRYLMTDKLLLDEKEPKKIQKHIAKHTIVSRKVPLHSKMYGVEKDLIGPHKGSPRYMGQSYKWGKRFHTNY